MNYAQVPSFGVVDGWLTPPNGVDFRDVGGIAVDATGKVYVAARTQPLNGIYVYSREGEYLDSWGFGDSTKVHGITATSDRLFVTDCGTHSVYVYSLDGELQMRIGNGTPSDTGYDASAPNKLATVKRAAGPFNEPTRAMPTSTGEILVSDGYGNARMHRFDPEGQLMNSWGAPGTAPGEFQLVHSVWVDGDDRVYVADRENDRVQIFTPAGELLEMWEDIPRAADVVISPDGLAYVGELFTRSGQTRGTGETDQVDRQSRVSIRDLDGKELGSLGGGEDRTASGNFASAHGIALDPVTGALYVGEVTATALSPRLNAGVDGYEPGMKTVQKFAVQKYNRVEAR